MILKPPLVESIRIVLVEPHYGGNVGSVCRACKTMGISKLYLVNPREFDTPETRAMAASAGDLLENAIHCYSLEEALEEVVLAIATSKRNRTASWPMINVPTTAEKLLQGTRQGEVALVFGPEPSGLSSEHLYQCQFQSYIDTAPEYTSLNLAQAVQIYTHAIYTRFLEGSLPDAEVKPERKELEYCLQQVEKLLEELEFAQQPLPQIMVRMRKILNSADLSARELGLLNGVLAALEERISDN